MPSFYDRMQATATRLLTKYGKAQRIQINRTTGATKNKLTGQISGGSEATIDLIGVVVSMPRKFIDDTRVLNSDRMLILDFSTEPDSQDEYLIDGTQYQFVELLEEVNPGGTVLLYKVAIRG